MINRDIGIASTGTDENTRTVFNAVGRGIHKEYWLADAVGDRARGSLHVRSCAVVEKMDLESLISKVIAVNDRFVKNVRNELLSVGVWMNPVTIQ